MRPQAVENGEFISTGTIAVQLFGGLNFKLDVGLYRLDQQVACQRIDYFLDAKSEKLAGLSESFVASLQAAFAKPALAVA